MLLLAAFILVPIIEIALFITVGERIGLWPTLAIVVVTALIGATAMRSQGQALMQRAASDMHNPAAIGKAMTDGMMLLFAGALLLTPGFFTDAIGFSLLVPAVRDFLRRKVLSRMAVSVTTATSSGGSQTYRQHPPSDERPSPHSPADRREEAVDDALILDEQPGDKNQRSGPSPWSQ
ncbi:MAG: FxsA family protein [Neomegalonema sp.]|nr:FxsA family protein [Neomegalonema sp.]